MMTYEQLGGKLSTNHPVAMVNVERRMCKCRKDKSHRVIRSSYPACVYKAFRDPGGLLTNEEIEAMLEGFWELEIKEVQKRHPEWVMEAYMVG